MAIRHFLAIRHLRGPVMSDYRDSTVFTPAGKRPLGKPRRRWEENIRMDLKEIGINMRNWLDSARDRDY